MVIPYGRQDITEEDIESVAAVLRSDFITQGAAVDRFESDLVEKIGADYCVAVNSATSALYLGCRALGLASGEYLWTSPITFVASANCGLACGAIIDFVDINPNTFNICCDALEEKLERANKIGKLPKVLVVVQMAGASCDMRRIRDLADRYEFYIIEDASHAIGGKFLGRYVGGCQFSDLSVFSFHPVKIITTGEGGAVLTNNPKIAREVEMLRSHGVTRDSSLMSGAPSGPWVYHQIDFSLNFRLTDFQAALGSSQLKRLDYLVEKRNFLSDRYINSFSETGLEFQQIDDEVYSSFHLFILKIDEKKVGVSRHELYMHLKELGVMANVHYIPVHTQPFFSKKGFKPSDFPASIDYYSKALTIPLFPTMGIEAQDYVINSVRSALPR